MCTWKWQTRGRAQHCWGGTDVSVRTHSTQTHTQQRGSALKEQWSETFKGKGGWGEGRASDRGARGGIMDRKWKNNDTWSSRRIQMWTCSRRSTARVWAGDLGRTLVKNSGREVRKTELRRTRWEAEKGKGRTSRRWPKKQVTQTKRVQGGWKGDFFKRCWVNPTLYRKDQRCLVCYNTGITSYKQTSIYFQGLIIAGAYLGYC